MSVGVRSVAPGDTIAERSGAVPRALAENEPFEDMVSVALIGADGTGKTTVGRRLELDPSLAVKYLYMGVNAEASNHMLPSTRLVLFMKRRAGVSTDAGAPPDPSRLEHRPPGGRARAITGVRSAARTVNQLAEEWYRQILAWLYQLRGYLVLFDRHFYPDFYAHDIGGNASRRLLSRRLHGFVLDRLYPRPDLVILLDAPAAVLFARKPEGTPALIERRRQEYLRLADRLGGFTIVDAAQTIDGVTRDVVSAIRRFQEIRT